MSQDSKIDRNKQIWTENDIEDMNWHNARVYGAAFYPETYELALDIDFVFYTEKHEGLFCFWMSPATIVFANVHDLELSISSWNGGLQISSIERTVIGKPKNQEYIQRDIEWLWLIDCEEGEIKLKSVGFTQYIRRPPILTDGQWLTPEERGESSFSRIVGPK